MAISKARGISLLKPSTATSLKHLLIKADILREAANAPMFIPPLPEGFISPMLWGIEDHVTERFASAGVAKENITFIKDTFTFNAPYSQSKLVSTFKNYYGPP